MKDALRTIAGILRGAAQDAASGSRRVITTVAKSIRALKPEVSRLARRMRSTSSPGGSPVASGAGPRPSTGPPVPVRPSQDRTGGPSSAAASTDSSTTSTPVMPAKKGAPAKNVSAAKKAAPAKKATPVKKAGPVGEAAAKKTAVPAKKTAPAKKATAEKVAPETPSTADLQVPKP